MVSKDTMMIQIEERLTSTSKVVATEVADGVAALELLVVFLDDVDEVLMDAVELCLVETLLDLVVDTCELVGGVPLAMAKRARHTVRSTG